MPLVAAAVCPHPPLLVPELAAGAAAELDDLRTACVAAVGRLLGAGADRIVAVGGGSATATHRGPGTFARYGVPVEVSLGEPDPAAVPPLAAPLPLSLLVGAWLLRRATVAPWAGPAGGPNPPAPVCGQAVDSGAAPADCAGLGRRLAASAGRVGLLVLGDGSACRGIRSPGYDDPRAEPFDRAVVRALAGGDVDALLSLDPALAAGLRVAGRAAWQVLAGAARATGGRWRGAVGYDAAPYGVSYFVASWESR